MNRDSDKTLSAGKADVNALDRSVFKRLGKAGAKSAEPNWMGDSGKGGQFVRMSIDPITVGTFLSGKLSVIETVNGLWAQGAVPCGIETVILLPEGTMESELRRMEDQIAVAAMREGVSVLGGHTEVTSAVSRPVIIGSGIGMRKDLGHGYCQSEVRAGFDGHVILMTSFAGLEGSAILGFEKEKELSGRFSATLVNTVKEAAYHLSVRPAAEVILDAFCKRVLEDETPETFCKNVLEEKTPEMRTHSGDAPEENMPRASVPGRRESSGHAVRGSSPPVLVNLSEGGFYAGLWKLAEKTHCGVDVDLKKVPIFQETIEIANFFDIDPYWMESAGSLLAAIPAGKAEEVLTRLAESSIPAAVIGTLNDSNQKIIRNGDEMRFLDRPQADSLRKILI